MAVDGLVSIEEVPPWLQFNPYIRTGYRPAPTTPAQALRSLFQWHNESINVWSHLIPALFLAWFVISPPGEGILLHFCVGSFLFIFSASVSYHLFMPCCSSETSYRTLLNCDVLGALVSITLSAFSFLLHGYRCTSSATVFGVSSLFASAACLLVYVNVKWKLTVASRVQIFGMLCILRLLLCFVTIYPKLMTHGFHLSLYYHVSSFFILLVGGLLNGLRIPERWFPQVRWLDYVLNSHNLWHFCCYWSCSWTMIGCFYDNLEWNLTRC